MARSMRGKVNNPRGINQYTKGGGGKIGMSGKGARSAKASSMGDTFSQMRAIRAQSASHRTAASGGPAKQRVGAGTVKRAASTGGSSKPKTVVPKHFMEHSNRIHWVGPGIRSRLVRLNTRGSVMVRGHKVRTSTGNTFGTNQTGVAGPGISYSKSYK